MWLEKGGNEPTLPMVEMDDARRVLVAAEAAQTEEIDLSVVKLSRLIIILLLLTLLLLLLLLLQLLLIFCLPDDGVCRLNQQRQGGHGEGHPDRQDGFVDAGEGD